MRRPTAIPPLWLFTDSGRMGTRHEAVIAAVRRLPPGLCGVVFRHDGVPGRATLARAIRAECNRRRLLMTMTAPVLPGLRRHAREGRGGQPGGTASAHGPAGLVRAARAGCLAAFLSPAFPTRSHPGASALGPLRWAKLARAARLPVLALGGIDGRTARSLPRWSAGAAAIGALLG